MVSGRMILIKVVLSMKKAIKKVSQKKEIFVKFQVGDIIIDRFLK